MPENITISRETLRAELSALELRLVDRIANALELKADAAIVNQLEARVQSLELSRAAREEMPSDLIGLHKRLDDLEHFRYAVPSVAVLALFVSVALAVFTALHT